MLWGAFPQQVSRDEVAEMVRDNALKHDLAQLWAQKSAQQKALQQLCAACAAGDVAAIRVRRAGGGEGVDVAGWTDVG